MKTIALVYTPRLNKLNACLAAVIAISVVLYGAFLLEAVANTAARTAAQSQLSDITSNIGTLEQQYLSATRDLTLEQAQSMGYVVPTQVTTVLAGNPIQTLTDNR